MIKKLNTKTLLILLAILIAVYAIIELTDGSGKSESFRSTLVNIDTAKVTQIEIEKAGTTLTLKKEDGWQVQNTAGAYVPAMTKSVDRLLGTLLTVKPSRIATKKPEKWADYQVDSTGTHVTVYEGSNKTLDLIVGRFAMQGQRQFLSYVRLADEDEVYAADNFMSMSMGTSPSAYRFREIARVQKDSLQQIQFQYADSAFTLNKQNGKWWVNEHPADSAHVASYINSLRNVTANTFVDDVEPAALISPSMTVVIQENGKDPLTISAYQHPEHQWIYHSSHNPDNLFSDESLKDKLFKDTTYFIAQ